MSLFSDIGHYSSINGTTKCDICPGGYYSSIQATACIICSAGSFAAPGSGKCTDCASGYYSSKDGMSECLSCNGFPHTDDRLGCKCSSGYYQNIYFYNSSSKQSASPVFSISPCIPYYDINAEGEKSIYSLFDPVVGSLFVLSCDPKRCAPANSCTNPSPSSFFSSYSNQSTAFNQIIGLGCCSENRLPAAINPLCGQCATGGNYYEWNKICTECVNGEWEPRLILSFFLLWILVYGLHKTSQQSSSDTKIFFYFTQVSTIIIK